MWTDTNIHLDDNKIKHCCKQKVSKIPFAELQSLGSDIFERHPLNIGNRKEMVEQNKLPASCQLCIDSEPNSIRHVWNKWNNEFIENNRAQLVDINYVNFIEIDVGKTCDMACIYCGSWASSKWAKELKISLKKEANDHWRNDVFKHLAEHIRNIPCDRKMTFNILGGEPLLIMDTYKMIEYFSERCKHFEKKPTLMITTNLNCKPKLLEKFLDILEKTKNIFEWIISISIENIGQMAEFVRYHLNWNRFERNIARIKDRVDQIYFTVTSNLFSFAQFDIFIDWAFETLGAPNYMKTWDFTFNIVQEGMTDIAYCDVDLVDVNHIKITYGNWVKKCNISADHKIEQFNQYIDDLHVRLGTKTANQEFEKWWRIISQRRGVNYCSMYPLNEIIRRIGTT